MLKAEEYRERRESVLSWPVRIVSYRLGDHWRCEIDNVDPGAQIARADGPTREEAEQQAASKAATRLGRTRVQQP
jgi:hypothetical protein